MYQYDLGLNIWDNWLFGKINYVISVFDGFVFVYDMSSVSCIFSSCLLYFKGVMFFYMLCWKLGDEVFFQGVCNYVDVFELVFGYVKFEDFKGYLEVESGQDLIEFFEDWFYGQGYLFYQMCWFQEGSMLYVCLNQ